MASTKKVRWWPFILLLAIPPLTWIGLSFDDDARPDERIVALGIVSALTAVAMLIWLFFFSRVSKVAALRVALFVFVLMALFSRIFQVDGFTGNLFPIVSLRGSKHEVAEKPSQIPDIEHPKKPSSIDQELVSHLDYPAFLGDRRSAVAPMSIHPDWNKNPPTLIWRRTMGAGWSSFAVSGNACITQEKRGSSEVVVRYDLDDGDVAWIYQSAKPGTFESLLAGDGPRATPTIVDGRVYTLASNGLLACLDMQTGSPYWTHDLEKEFHVEPMEYGRSNSPLLVDGMVVIPVGGPGQSLVAFDMGNGEPRWHAGDDLASYSSPTVMTLLDTRQIVSFNRQSISGHDIASGRMLWSFPWQCEPGQHNVSQPTAYGNNRVVFFTGFTVGGAMIELKRQNDGAFQVDLAWRSTQFRPNFGNFICVNEFLYGLDGGILTCLDLNTGKRVWKKNRLGLGQILLAHNGLLGLLESGEIVLLGVTPQGASLKARMQAVEGKTWNHPALASPYLLVRNSQEAACYRLPTIEP